ncbi:MAG: PIN domain-containing protein [Candidatus Acidiferrales bacterium]
MILLDTQVLSWLASEPVKLSRKASDAIRQASPNGRIAVSAISYSRDPCDRLIGTTALAESIALVTRDDRMRAWTQIRTIW